MEKGKGGRGRRIGQVAHVLYVLSIKSFQTPPEERKHRTDCGIIYMLTLLLPE